MVGTAALRGKRPLTFVRFLVGPESKRLADGYLRGDARVIEQVRRAIEPLIVSKIVNPDDWEDLRQHCLEELLTFLRQVDSVQNFWALVRRITVNSVSSYNAKSLRWRKLVDGDEADTVTGLTRTETARSTESDTWTRFQARDRIRYIFNLIPKKCREIFHLIFVQDLTYAESAEKLAISEGNLRVRLNRCRDRAVALDQKAANFPL